MCGIPDEDAAVLSPVWQLGHHEDGVNVVEAGLLEAFPGRGVSPVVMTFAHLFDEEFWIGFATAVGKIGLVDGEVQNLGGIRLRETSVTKDASGTHEEGDAGIVDEALW